MIIISFIDVAREVRNGRCKLGQYGPYDVVGGVGGRHWDSLGSVLVAGRVGLWLL